MEKTRVRYASHNPPRAASRGSAPGVEPRAGAPLGARALCALALVAGSLGCAPSQSFRPALSPGVDHHQELGLALSTVEPRQYVAEPARRLAQGWWTQRLGRRWAFSTLVGFDASAVLAGVAFRFDALRTRWFVAAAEVDAGFLWGGLSLPLAARIADVGGVYCAPRLGNWGSELAGSVPCGVEVALLDGLAARAELQLGWADFAYYNRRLHWGVGVAHQW